MATITLSVTEARNEFLNLIREAKALLEQVIITKNGKPEAVLMSYEEYESWMETLAIAQDADLMNGIRRAKSEIKTGQLYSKETVFSLPPKKKAEVKRK